jgi:hypothetical protein
VVCHRKRVTLCRASLAFALAGLPLVGQALHVSSVSGSPGDKIAIEISLVSSVGEGPDTLKWETIFPAQLLEVVGGPEAAGAAKESGKSLTCTQRESYLYVCILAGGQKPIANGPIARFPFRIRADAHPGTANVRTSKVEAVTKDLKTLKLSGSDGQLHIR